MTVKTGLPGPEGVQVKIWFQGSTGSGKTLLARMVERELRRLGVEFTSFAQGERGVHVARNADRWVDLTQQNVDDVITVDLRGVDGLMKLIRSEVSDYSG